MKNTGEWGEFFPIEKSVYAYNETLAQEQIPLNEKELLKRGWIYKDLQKEQKYQGAKYQIPDNIKDVPDNIIQQILFSEKSGQAYKIIKEELQFYRKQGIPIPRLTPDERHFERMENRTKRVMHERTCQKCQKNISTIYSPDRAEIVYCEACFLKEIY